MWGDDYLAHYGVLGMKWGRHRTPDQLVTRNQRIDQKVKKYDYLATKNKLRAEKARMKQQQTPMSQEDLRKHNEAVKYKVKELKLETKAAKIERNPGTGLFNSSERAARLQARGLKYASKYLKATGEQEYGAKGYSSLLKSQKFLKRAAKGRLQIQKNLTLIRKLEAGVNS